MGANESSCERIPIFHMRRCWLAPWQKENHFNVLWWRSNSNDHFTSLLAYHVTSDDWIQRKLSHMTLCFIISSTSAKITRHREEYRKLYLSRFSSLFTMAQQWSRYIMTHRGGIYFWKTISLAIFFLCSPAAIQNYFSQFTFYTSDTYRVKSITCPEWELFSHSHQLCMHIWTPRLDIRIPIVCINLVMHDIQGLYERVICRSQAWSCSFLIVIPRLPCLWRSNLLWWIQSNNMDRCNYIMPQIEWRVKMPINRGQYHQTIASHWISHLVDNLLLSDLMVAHLASAQLTNPPPIVNEPVMIIFSHLSHRF